MGITANPYKEYKRQDIMMASPLELIVMLYSGCIKQLKLAKLALGKKQYDQANKDLQKAQDIITELMMCLDFNYDISKELMDIYEFILSQIISINISKDEKPIEAIIDMLSKLRSTWVQVQKETKIKSVYHDYARVE